MDKTLAVVGVRNVGRWVAAFKVDRAGREIVTLTKNRAEAAKFSEPVALRVAWALDAFIDRVD